MRTLFSRHPLYSAIMLASLFPVTAMAANSETSAEQVVSHYADLAHANYQEALTTARNLDKRIDALLAEPSADTLAAARHAWREARVPYQQSEVFRFGNPVVDDWEGQLNAWPLDEGMIDYVARNDYQHELGNAGATANIIANQTLQIGGETLDVSQLTPSLLADLNEIGGSEANVATGYHAIEFLRWGQDLNGFNAGSGERPASDFMTGDDCTHGHCQRRGAYLDAASELLIDDLAWMVSQWSAEHDDNYRQALLAAPAEEGLRRMLFGMGSLSLGELAGERMKVALEANSVEDEHDCLSDNTHNSHYYNGQGIQNVYTGTYRRLDGTSLQGPSLSDLVAAADPALDTTLKAQLNSSMDELTTLKQAAEDSDNPMPFDMMIAPGNETGTRLVNNSILALVNQTGSIEKAASTLGVSSLQSDDAGHTF